jgi:hypothetical protein
VVCGMWYVVCGAALEAMRDIKMEWDGRLQATLRTPCFVPDHLLLLLLLLVHLILILILILI